MNGMLDAIDNGLISACHDVSEGGTAVCITEMAVGNRIGTEINLENIPGSDREDVLLFSETVTRWIVSVPKNQQKQFEKTLSAACSPFSLIGETKGNHVCFKKDGKTRINEDIEELYTLWENGVSSIMG